MITKFTSNEDATISSSMKGDFPGLRMNIINSNSEEQSFWNIDSNKPVNVYSPRGGICFLFNKHCLLQNTMDDN